MGHAQRANIHEAVQQAVEAWEDPNIDGDGSKGKNSLPKSRVFGAVTNI